MAVVAEVFTPALAAMKGEKGLPAGWQTPLGGIFGPLKSDLGVFWPFRGTDFIMGILKIWDNFLGPNGPILKFTFLESLRNL